MNFLPTLPDAMVKSVKAQVSRAKGLEFETQRNGTNDSQLTVVTTQPGAQLVYVFSSVSG